MTKLCVTPMALLGECSKSFTFYVIRTIISSGYFKTQLWLKQEAQFYSELQTCRHSRAGLQLPGLSAFTKSPARCQTKTQSTWTLHAGRQITPSKTPKVLGLCIWSTWASISYSINEVLTGPQHATPLDINSETILNRRTVEKTQVPEAFDEKAEQKALNTYVYLVHHTPLEFYNSIN